MSHDERSGDGEDARAPATAPVPNTALPVDPDHLGHLVAIVDNAPDVLSLFGRDLRYLFINRTAERSTGIPREFFLGKTFREVGFPEENCVQWEAALRHVFDTGEPAFIEFSVPLPAGLRHYEGRSAAQRDPDGRVATVLTITRDVTERRQAQDALESAFKQQYRIATSLQRALLHLPPPDSFPGLAFATIYESAGREAEVGGDFYDVIPLEGGKVALALGDISGKGLEAAAHMAQVKFTLRAYLQEYDEPARTLERLNSFLVSARPPGAAEAEDGVTFACLALAVLDPATGRGAIAVAGAEPPLLLRAGGDGRRETFDASGLPLGIAPQEYEQAALHLDPGDLLVLATDGLTEARDGGGAFLGGDGLERLVREAAGLEDLDAMGRTVLAGVRAFSGGAQRDDACLLLARRRA